MVAALVLVLFVIATLVVAGLRARRPLTAPGPEVDPAPVRTAVRVLRTEEELVEAIDRAVEAEQRAAARSSARIDRYTRLLGDGAASTDRTRLREVELAS